MAATVIVELPGTSTTEINKKLNELREKTGAITLGRVLTDRKSTRLNSSH